jgi:large subunit ribosomal protein L23
MKTLEDKLIQLKMSEKAAKRQASLNEYTLVVDKLITKTEIKEAVKKVFGVNPQKVRTVIFRTKTKRTRYGTVAAKSYKKALIRLPEGERIEIK